MAAKKPKYGKGQGTRGAPGSHRAQGTEAGGKFGTSKGQRLYEDGSPKTTKKAPPKKRSGK